MQNDLFNEHNASHYRNNAGRDLYQRIKSTYLLTENLFNSGKHEKSWVEYESIRGVLYSLGWNVDYPSDTIHNYSCPLEYNKIPYLIITTITDNPNYPNNIKSYENVVTVDGYKWEFKQKGETMFSINLNEPEEFSDKIIYIAKQNIPTIGNALKILKKQSIIQNLDNVFNSSELVGDFIKSFQTFLYHFKESLEPTIRNSPIVEKYLQKQISKIITNGSEEGSIKVTFPDGTIIVSENSTQTFMETIRKIGIEKIYNSRANKQIFHSNERKRSEPVYLIQTTKFNYGHKEEIINGQTYYIFTHNTTQAGGNSKYNLLKFINEELRLHLDIEIIYLE